MEPPRVCGWMPTARTPSATLRSPRCRLSLVVPGFVVRRPVLRSCNVRTGVCYGSVNSGANVARPGARLPGVPPLVGVPLVRALEVRPLLDDDEVVVAVHGGDVEVGV